MTREEEIKKVSKQRHLKKYNCKGFCPDFEAGIRWDDIKKELIRYKQ